MISFNILIPTFNRPNYLNRILSFYNEKPDDYSIIVADSSDKKNIDENSQIISSYSRVKIVHDRYPNSIKFEEKINKSLKNCKEKYTVFCADDDFIAINGIKEGIFFLDKHPDFSCAQGDYIRFYTKNSDFFYFKKKTFETIDSDDPSVRLIEHFSNYRPSFYAVHKTSFTKMIFEESTRFTDDNRFGELLPSMLSAIYGKMKKINGFYGGREEIPGCGGASSKRIQDFINEGTFKSKYSNFKNCLCSHLMKNTDISLKDAGKIVDLGWVEYTKKHKGYKIPKINYMMKQMPLPSVFDKGLRKMYRKVNNKSKKPIVELGSEVDPDLERLEDFKNIKKSVLSHTKDFL